MRNFLIFIVPIALLLSGCSKMMNENECLVADWRTIGFQDGSAGRTTDWLAKRGEACAEFGVAPNMDQYLMGRDQGLQTFCQPRRGFELGRRNVRYDSVCPPNLEGNFLNAYQDGRGLSEREAIITNLDRAVIDTIATIDDLERMLTEDAIALAMIEMAPEERIDYALTIKNMAEDRGRLMNELPQMQADLAFARLDLSAYASSIAGRYPGGI